MKTFFPPIEQITKEVISSGIALIVVAYLASQYPKLRALIKDYQAP